MEQNKQKLTDIITKLKEKGLVILNTNTTPFNMDRFKDLIEKLKVKQNE